MSRGQVESASVKTDGRYGNVPWVVALFSGGGARQRHPRDAWDAKPCRKLGVWPTPEALPNAQ